MNWLDQLCKLSRSRGGSRAWTIALALFATSLAVRFLFAPSLHGLKFLTFYPAIALATLVCGWPQGVVVLVLSALSAWYFLFVPSDVFSLNYASEAAALFGFMMVAGFVVVLVGILRETIRRLDLAKAAQETLFSELQHRVANNLQLVVALLRNAQRNLRNPVVAAETLNDAEERIIAMSKLHRHLHDGTAFVNGLEPLLREMLSNTFQHLPVTVGINVRDVSDLSIDQMTAITLLVNEAAINAAKHVFSKGRGRTFNVCLREAKGRLRLDIQDDGPGIREDAIGAEAHSLGMGIMEAFANQLGGPLEVANDGGASLSVEFGASRS
ncbi:histidine kinase dimerization/phosphoacceptor domain -containing protein [Methylocystis sp. IM3]|uniref:sensor histidine kinase n=1 Tax=unclassified Methylocystis TaxID=2625913 RepID=UPI0030F4EA82